jgi:hypothetical protein
MYHSYPTTHLTSLHLASPHLITSHPSPSFPFPFYPNPSHSVLAPPTRPTRTRNQYDSRQSIMRRRAETIQRRGTVHHFVANTCIDFRVNTQGLLVICCSSLSLFTQLPPLRSSPYSQTDLCIFFSFFPLLVTQINFPTPSFQFSPWSAASHDGVHVCFFCPLCSTPPHST